MPALTVEEVQFDNDGRATVEATVESQRIEMPRSAKEGADPVIVLTLRVETPPHVGKHIWYRGSLGPENWRRLGRDGSIFGTGPTLEKAFGFHGHVGELRTADFTGTRLRVGLGRHDYEGKRYLDVKGLWPIREDALSTDQWERLMGKHGITGPLPAAGGAAEPEPEPARPIEQDLPF